VIGAWAIVFAALLQAFMPPLRSLDKGGQSRVTSRREVTVTDSNAWSALWRDHAGDRPQPQVDFSREMVVGVFLGTRPTAGFSVEILGYRVAGDNTVVEYREASPPPGAIVAQVLTSPYHLVAIPRRLGNVAFDRAKS
jgi:hypothetical protein